MLFEQLFKPLDIYLFDAARSCFFNNELQGETVGGKELEGVLRSKFSPARKACELFNTPLERFPKPFFFLCNNLRNLTFLCFKLGILFFVHVGDSRNYAGERVFGYTKPIGIEHSAADKPANKVATL